MSQSLNEGAPAPVPSLAQAPAAFRVIVDVSPDAILSGHNAAGPTALDIDVGALGEEDRATLHRLVRAGSPADVPERAQVGAGWRLRDGRAPVTLRDPTGEAFARELGRLTALHAAEMEIVQLSRHLVETADLTLARVLARTEPSFGLLHVVEDEFAQAVARLAPGLLDAVRAALPATVPDSERRLLAAHARAAEIKRAAVVPSPHATPGARDWFVARLEVVPASEAIARVQDLAPTPLRRHRSHAASMDDVLRDRNHERQRAASPKGRIEAVIRELGTESQAERWREGMLPAAEADAILAAHVFREALAMCPAERRLEREDVVVALGKERPSASLAKVTFATEEADGLDETEWTAFKALRAVLPHGASAHVVRTVASVQTQAHGAVTFRRALATLRAPFEGRDVRARVELGTGLRVAAG